MRQVVKAVGATTAEVVEAPIPEPGPGQVRVRAVRSLISRGSETGRLTIGPDDERYSPEEAAGQPVPLGYSLAGVVDALGPGVARHWLGKRVVAREPHAEYVVVSPPAGPSDQPNVFPIPDGMSLETAAYWILAAAAATWVEIERVQPRDSIVILGQGLVGSLMLQVLKAAGHGPVVAVDALELRCDLADRLGADIVINAASEDPVKAVRSITAGVGADIVIYAVGGSHGAKAFLQALDMLAVGGLLHLIGLCEPEPLPLPSTKIQGRRLLGGYYGRANDAWTARMGMALLASGAINTSAMTTHRFPADRAGDAFALLQERPGDTLGVILEWDADSA